MVEQVFDMEGNLVSSTDNRTLSQSKEQKINELRGSCKDKMDAVVDPWEQYILSQGLMGAIEETATIALLAPFHTQLDALVSQVNSATTNEDIDAIKWIDP